MEVDSIRIASGLDKRMVRRMGREESRMLCRFVVINSCQLVAAFTEMENSE